MKSRISLAYLVLLLFSQTSDATVSVDWVTVGNPGNAPDPLPFVDGSGGAVSDVYRMGKYEVTAGQYTAFLNAVAKADPNGLYNTNMGFPGDIQGANIKRTGDSPNYSYSVAPDWANRPVNYVSFWDAARFANWLHNGQPTGAQGPGTTEDGAYHHVGEQFLFGRNPGARFFIPTNNEWYKAGFHKDDGTTGNYWDFATSSNTSPLNSLPDPGNHANFQTWDSHASPVYTIGDPYYRTEVGAFVNSPSPYGTFDQAGNVREWTETASSFFNGLFDRRTATGGQYNDGSSFGGIAAEPASEFSSLGFRVAASVPEPASLALGMAGLLVLTLRRRLQR